ncbi:hypothetical protein ACWCOP_00645 [Maricaulaceae bacterium MS644]
MNRRPYINPDLAAASLGAAALLLVFSLGREAVEDAVYLLVILPTISASAMALFIASGPKDRINSWRAVPDSLAWVYVFAPSAIYVATAILAEAFGVFESVAWIAAALGVAVGGAVGEWIRAIRTR